MTFAILTFDLWEADTLIKLKTHDPLHMLYSCAGSGGSTSMVY